MIGLTRLSNLQRAIITGDGGMELCLALKRRGFVRAATVSMCRIPRRQHAIGLIAGREPPDTIEKALSEISPFVAAQATIAVLIRESGSSVQIRTRLQQMGFQIEAGVRCQHGLVLSACRQGFIQMEDAA